MSLAARLNSPRVETVVDLAALLYSLGMLAALLPSVHITPLIQILYYLVVPGHALLRLVNFSFGLIDRAALTLAISLGLLVGLVAFFQTFYPTGRLNQALFIPVIAIVALALSLRSLLAKRSKGV